MPRQCPFTGKKTQSGRQYTRRGKAKYLGGVGRKITGKTKRKFNPNLQSINILVEGKRQKENICTKCLKAGKVVKFLARA